MRATVSNRLTEQSVKNIKRAMLEADVRGQQIAARLNVSRQLVSQVVNGRKRSRRVEAAISRAVNIPRSQLWTPSAN